MNLYSEYKITKDAILKCRFCGFESTADDFDLDKLGHGFWCNDCDGYTYWEDSSNFQHSFTLILEDKAKQLPLARVKGKRISWNKRLSPLRYPGGKSKLIELIYHKMQEGNMDTLVEPFAGGASVGLALLNARIIKSLILNDLDFGVFSLFKLIKESPNLLIERIMKFTPTHDDYFRYQESIKSNYTNCDHLEAAWQLLTVNRLAYSGIYKANPLGGKNGSNASLLQRWNPEDLCSRIVKIHAVSKWITISNIDACELIEELYWMPATTILVDPPYYKQGKNLYKCYYDENDHSRLNMLLENLYHGCPGADIILTYDNVPFIADLYVYPDTEVIGRVYTI